MEQPVTIEPGKTEFIHTGIAIAIPEGLVGLVYARSGMACKKGIAPANKVGVIDAVHQHFTCAGNRQIYRKETAYFIVAAVYYRRF